MILQHTEYSVLPTVSLMVCGESLSGGAKVVFQGEIGCMGCHDSSLLLHFTRGNRCLLAALRVSLENINNEESEVMPF